MDDIKKRLTILVRSIGPYHNARFKALQKSFEVSVIETRPFLNEYDWNKNENKEIGYNIEPVPNISKFKRIIFIWKTLKKQDPQAIFTHGWADFEYHLALVYSKLNGIKIITGCDSTFTDTSRNYFKEKIKGIVLKQFNAFISAGKRSDEYLKSLNINKNIFKPYDVVDNNYFLKKTGEFRKNPELIKKFDLPKKYILNVSRFIPKKNHLMLIEAYHETLLSNPGFPYDLVLVGSGELKQQIEHSINKPGLLNSVRIFPFAQYSELPLFYAYAGIFILASKTDQWGLVVNEAMASGLPVLVSEGCGCADDLVYNKINGFKFIPEKHEIIKILKELLNYNEDELSLMGNKSKEIISNYYGLNNFDAAFQQILKNNNRC